MATVKMVALAQFIASKLGKTGLTVTCDVDEYDIDNSTVDNAFLTAQSMTEVRRGIYRLFFDGDDTKLYTATAITADSSVDQQHIAAVIVRLDRMNNADVTTSSRLASASYTAPLDASATQTAAEAALTAYDAATGADVAAISVPSAATVADAVWDEALSGHAVAGSTGAALSTAGGAADPLLNTVPGDYASGTAGAALGRIVGASITIQSPTSDNGDIIQITGGDDYLHVDGRAIYLTWGDTHPSAVGGSITLTITDDPTVEYSGVVTDARAGYIEFTSAQTTAIQEAGDELRDFRVRVVQSSGHKYSPVTGKILVL